MRIPEHYGSENSNAFVSAHMAQPYLSESSAERYIVMFPLHMELMSKLMQDVVPGICVTNDMQTKTDIDS